MEQNDYPREKFEEKIQHRSDEYTTIVIEKTNTGHRFMYGGPAHREKDNAKIDVWPLRSVTCIGFSLTHTNGGYRVHLSDDNGFVFNVDVEDWRERAEIGDAPLSQSAS